MLLLLILPVRTFILSHLRLCTPRELAAQAHLSCQGRKLCGMSCRMWPCTFATRMRVVSLLAMLCSLCIRDGIPHHQRTGNFRYGFQSLALRHIVPGVHEVSLVFIVPERVFPESSSRQGFSFCYQSLLLSDIIR